MPTFHSLATSTVAAPSRASLSRPTAAPTPNTAQALRRAARHFRAAALALRQAWQARQRRAADRHWLQGMSTRELTDLGLGRGEIDHLTQPRPARHDRHRP